MIQGDREILAEDIEHIRLILRRFPTLSRKEIVHTLCETLDWLTPAGLPKVNACTKLLHRLEEQGNIRLPAKQQQYSHPASRGVSAPVLSSRTAAQPPLNISLKALGAVRLVPLSDKADQALWNEYIERYHYLGYKRPFGYRQSYFIEAGQLATISPRAFSLQRSFFFSPDNSARHSLDDEGRMPGVDAAALPRFPTPPQPVVPEAVMQDDAPGDE